MKLHTDHHEVERSNVASETEFKIKTTAKAFAILSEGIYTDPILAVVRELSCNAYDAHIAANNQAGFEIHVPNSLEPWFHVKDFGTGLSDEDVMNLYSTYFESTKTDSNDFIGALGLGSKSPFSYTKAFEVISRFEHVKRTYSIFVDNGVPTIARLGEFITDEHNGLEVRITVKKDDFWTFQEKVRAALRWFPTKPTIVGASRFEWPEAPKESLSGKGWAMFDSEFADGYTKMTAVQGNVAYKVDISKLNLTEADTNMLENCHIVGFFDIGTLEVAASREEIRYDDRSAAALVKKIKDVRAGILLSVEKRVEALQQDDKMSLWTIMIQLNKMAEEMFGDHSLFKEFLEPSKNVAIEWYLETGGTLKLPDLHGHAVSGYTLPSGGDPAKASIKRSHFGSGIEPDTDIVVFFNDMKTGGIAKVTHYLRTKAWTTIDKAQIHRTAVIIRRLEKTTLLEKPDPKNPLHVTNVVWSEEEYQEEYDNIVIALGYVEVKMVSTDAPAPPRGRNGDYKSVPIFKFNKVNVRRYGKSTIVWDRIPSEELDLTQDSLYFFVRNGAHITVVGPDGKDKDVTWDVSKTEEYIKAAIKLINDAQGTKFTMKNVFAVGSMASKKIKKLPNWVNLFDALKTQMDQFKPAVEYFKKIQNTADVMGIRDAVVTNRGSHRTNLIDKVEKLKKTSAFKLVLEPLIEDALKYENLNTTCAFVQKLDVDLGTKIFDNVASKGYYGKNAFEDYPMLSFVNHYQYLDRKQLDLFFDYINTIDRS